MNSFRFRSSLTKNWPSGRRNAHPDRQPVNGWSKKVVNLQRPYVTEEKPSEGGMADVSTEQQG